MTQAPELEPGETPLDRMIEDHWKYVSGVLFMSRGQEKNDLAEIEFHYKSAFRHGYKHGCVAKSAEGG